MNGVTALLIPGNMCDARMWRGGSDIIRRKLRESLGFEPVDADTFQDDSVAAMASRALESITGSLLPIGFSMGAIVAVEMALQAPDRVRGLVLSGYNAGADLAERASMRPLQQVSVRCGHLKRVLIEELKPLYLATENKSDPHLRALLCDMAMAAGPEVFVSQSEALRTRTSRITNLGELNIPVLYVAGREDRLCPPQWHVRWSSLTPNSRFVEIGGAGHMAPLEQPARFANALVQWITNNTERLAA